MSIQEYKIRCFKTEQARRDLINRQLMESYVYFLKMRLKAINSLVTC